MENKNKFKNCIFLDIDGVLNHELFYIERYKEITRYNNIPLYKLVKKKLRKLVKKKKISRIEYYQSQIDSTRMELINNLCEETNSCVVLSSTWRNIGTITEIQNIFKQLGATFTIIDKTGQSKSRIRGVEINEWLKHNCMCWFDVEYYNFYRYVIIDDDSDMLLWQQNHFFPTDNYIGLTPTTCYKIKRFFTHETF